jgi:hypothetical protein
MDEGMLDFYRTQAGRRFFDGTLPRIAKEQAQTGAQTPKEG